MTLLGFDRRQREPFGRTLLDRAVDGVGESAVLAERDGGSDGGDGTDGLGGLLVGFELLGAEADLLAFLGESLGGFVLLDLALAVEAGGGTTGDQCEDTDGDRADGCSRLEAGAVGQEERGRSG